MHTCWETEEALGLADWLYDYALVCGDDFTEEDDGDVEDNAEGDFKKDAQTHAPVMRISHDEMINNEIDDYELATISKRAKGSL